MKFLFAFVKKAEQLGGYSGSIGVWIEALDGSRVDRV